MSLAVAGRDKPAPITPRLSRSELEANFLAGRLTTHIKVYHSIDAHLVDRSMGQQISEYPASNVGDTNERCDRSVH